jgi:hypothetical protein
VNRARTPTLFQLTMVAATLAPSQASFLDEHDFAALASRAYDLWQACESELKNRRRKVPTKPANDDARVTAIMREVTNYPVAFKEVARIVVGGERVPDRMKLLRDYFRERAERDFYAEDPRRSRLGRHPLSEEQREDQAAASLVKMTKRELDETELKQFASDFIGWKDAHNAAVRSDKARTAARKRWQKHTSS